MMHTLTPSGRVFWVLGSAPTGLRREEIPLARSLAEKSGPGGVFIGSGTGRLTLLREFPSEKNRYGWGASIPLVLEQGYFAGGFSDEIGVKHNDAGFRPDN